MDSSRRELIKTLGLVAGSIMAGEIMPLAGYGETLNGRKTAGEKQKRNVQAMLLGTGSRGLRFARFAMRQPHQLTITAIAEPKDERRLNAGNLLKLNSDQLFNNWQELLNESPEARIALVTCTGNYMEVCTMALKAGYNVWVDKPVSLNKADLVTINAFARDCNRQLLFCYTHENSLNFMDHRLFENNPAKV